MTLNPTTRESIGIGVLCLAAFAWRVWDLPGPTITHPEAFAPGLEFPDFAGHPVARHTFTDIVRSTWTGDNHPPGYYFLMLPWTTLFGTDLTTLRLPSAIIGALTVPLLFAAVRRTEGSWVAALSATWLAFHGHHILWSRHARMWVVSAALVVLSVWAATKLRERYQSGWAVVYLVSVVAGLWLEYSFWPVFAAQFVWQAAAAGRVRGMPPTLVLQGLALALASPVFVFLFSQLDDTEYLQSSVLEHLLYTAGFGRWFETGVIFGSGVLERSFHLVLALCGAILVAFGVREGLHRGPDVVDDTPSPRYLAWSLWLSILLPAFFVWRWYDLFLSYGRRSAVIALAVPPALAFVYYFASRYWRTVRDGLSRTFDSRPIGPLASDACVMHSLAPLLLLSLVHLAVPSLAARALLATTPFLLVLAARGLGRLVRRPTSRGFAIVAVALLGVIGSMYVPPPPRDYEGLAKAIDTARKTGDVLVIEDAWYAQALHYYLPPDAIMSYEHARLGTTEGRTRFVDHVQRAWVVGFGPDPRARVSELCRPLSGFRELQFVSAFEAGAALLERER